MKQSVLRRSLGLAIAALAFAGASAHAAPIAVTTFTSNTGLAQTLTNAVLVPGSGINVVGGSAVYQGSNTSANHQ
ncbi:MAG: hypothetical protein ACLGI6_21525, partial [Gammaproteobacteria bacterium]